ncbi:unnamed protein product [Symbiodinium pilosum]|uniref:PDZ domain-containing protein n=1 Tax=Symbiodinium pilosum TaxID=2952 RepID=A0A812V5M3_SYMPI|nr:unnamed protein product [Symbiodinium pilosum]
MTDGYKVSLGGAGGAGGRGVDVITDHEGEVVGIAVSQVAQVYTMVDRILSSPRILALPLSDRYTLAGKVAAVPDEHARLIERLASAIATAFSEAGALNALYLIEICKELVPGFKDKLPEGRLEKAAELTPHQRAKDFVLQNQRPLEWDLRADEQKPAVILLPEEDTDLLTETGRAVGDATKFVGGAAFGGVGLVTDTLGITKNAEDKLASTAEDAVDLVGSGVSSVVGAVDQGLDGTAKDLQRKGVVGAVGDGVADAVDIVSDFVSDTVTGIADGVHGILNFATGTDEKAVPVQETHLVKIVIAELIGAEKTLGLRIESRVVTAFTREQAARFGWRLGDCILAVGRQRVPTQEALLAGIASCKEALRTNGTPIEFLVERMGNRP